MPWSRLPSPLACHDFVNISCVCIVVLHSTVVREHPLCVCTLGIHAKPIGCPRANAAQKRGLEGG